MIRNKLAKATSKASNPESSSSEISSIRLNIPYAYRMINPQCSDLPVNVCVLVAFRSGLLCLADG